MWSVCCNLLWPRFSTNLSVSNKYLCSMLVPSEYMFSKYQCCTQYRFFIRTLKDIERLIIWPISLSEKSQLFPLQLFIYFFFSFFPVLDIMNILVQTNRCHKKNLINELVLTLLLMQTSREFMISSN